MMDRWSGAIACSVLLGSLACAAGHGVISERVGGRARQRAEASPVAYEAFLRAELAERAGEHDAAQRELERAEDADPSDGYLPARRGELLMARELPRAVSTLRDAVARHPEASAGWLALASALRASGDPAGAREAAAQAIVLDGDDPEVRAQSAEAAGAERSSEARPRGEAARRQRAAECFRNGQWREVDLLLSPRVEMGSAQNADRVRLIEARARDGRPADAARLVPGVSIVGNGAVSRAERARLWLLGERAEQARMEALQALAEGGDDPRAELVLGESWALSGRWDLALVHFATISAGEDGFAESRAWSARGLSARGLRADARRVLDRAIAELSAGSEREREGLRALRESMSQP